MNKSLRGVSLIEIIISMLILALVMTGLVNLFISGKRWLMHSRLRMTAGELGKYYLDPLQMQVRQGESQLNAQDGWDQVNNKLYLAPCPCPPGQESRSWADSPTKLDNIDYTPNYVVSRVRDPGNNDTGLRRVKVAITWNEPAP